MDIALAYSIDAVKYIQYLNKNEPSSVVIPGSSD
jgi:hypothetical protein